MAVNFFPVLLQAHLFLLFHVSTQRLDFQSSWQDNNFTYSNCNTSAVPLFVHSIKLTKNPVRLDQVILLFVKMSLDRDVGENHNSIEVDLNFRLKTERGYTELCDIIGERNCHFNDLCVVLQNYVKKHKCPNDHLKIDNNCTCPFKKGEYAFPIFIPPHPLSFELRGTFDLTINLQEQGTHLGCVDMQFCVNNCQPLSPKYKEKKIRELSKLDRQ